MQFSKVKSITLTITVLLLLTLTSHAENDIEKLIRENVSRLKDVHTWTGTMLSMQAERFIRDYGREAYEKLIYENDLKCPTCRRVKEEKTNAK